MKFKKHMVLEIENNGKYRSYPDIKIRIRNGATSDTLSNELLTDWTPDPKDRLYFFPGCAVPRFKVREKYNTTIKPEYATAAFMSPSGMKSSDTMFDVMQNAVSVDGEFLGKWFAYIYGESHHFVVKYKSLLLNCADEVMIDEMCLYKFKYGCPADADHEPTTLGKWAQFIMIEDHNKPSLKISEPTVFISPVIGSSLDKLNCPIYIQDAILKYLNEDNIVIDDRRYEELRLMAKSDDKENIILVMELMSNANFEKSFVYLLLLLKEFNSKIISRRKEIKHVNFLALLNFLELEPKKLNGVTIEQLMTGMKKHKQFTRSNVQRITKFFINGSNMSFHTDHFTAGPVLRPEAEILLDDEIQDNEEEEDQDEIKADIVDNFNL